MIASALAALPDDTRCYVVGVGEVTIGEIRATEQTPALDDILEATYQMWEDIATRNLCRDPWQDGVTVSDVKAFHASRFSSGLTRRASS